jgi:hypothetical protein
MKQLKIKFMVGGKVYNRTAILTDDLRQLSKSKRNQCEDIVNGVADELGIWSLNFDNGTIECDFRAHIDEDGNEVCTLEPYEVLIWNNEGGGCITNDFTPFTVTVKSI